MAPKKISITDHNGETNPQQEVSTVACKYAKYGCKVVLPAETMPDHMEKWGTDHLDMLEAKFEEEVDGLHKQVSSLENDVRELKKAQSQVKVIKPGNDAFNFVRTTGGAAAGGTDYDEPITMEEAANEAANEIALLVGLKLPGVITPFLQKILDADKPEVLFAILDYSVLSCNVIIAQLMAYCRDIKKVLREFDSQFSGFQATLDQQTDDKTPFSVNPFFIFGVESIKCTIFTLASTPFIIGRLQKQVALRRIPAFDEKKESFIEPVRKVIKDNKLTILFSQCSQWVKWDDTQRRREQQFTKGGGRPSGGLTSRNPNTQQSGVKHSRESEHNSVRRDRDFMMSQGPY